MDAADEARPGARPPALEVRRLARTSYAAAHALQQELVAARIEDRIPDQLLLLEHDAVITVGRGGDPMPRELGGVPVVEVERGGEATYHGPGQLVGYPILRLEGTQRDLHRYLRDLEEVLIRALAGLGIAGSRRPGLTGVWIGPRKVASLGVAVRRWVAWHGFALNVDNDAAAFRAFRPCGLDPDVMTRVSDHARVPADDPLLAAAVEREFRAVFRR